MCRHGRGVGIRLGQQLVTAYHSWACAPATPAGHTGQGCLNACGNKRGRPKPALSYSQAEENFIFPWRSFSFQLSPPYQNWKLNVPKYTGGRKARISVFLLIWLAIHFSVNLLKCQVIQPFLSKSGKNQWDKKKKKKKTLIGRASKTRIGGKGETEIS